MGATRQLLCKWGERKVFLRDRRNLAALDMLPHERLDRVVEDAISHVLTASGEETGFIRSWTLPPERASRLWDRAGIADDPITERDAFLDRHGQLHLSWVTALKFVQAFAAREPEPVMHYVTELEEELRAKGYQPGERWWHEYLRSTRPATALVRQWAGAGEAQQLAGEVGRLQGLVAQAIRELRAGGLEKQARCLELTLEGK